MPIAVPFYMWLGIVSLLGISQFWSLAADLHSREAGERLFGVIAVGGSAGAIVGAQAARRLIEPLGIYGLMMTAAALYVVALVVVGLIERTSPGPAAARAARAGGASHHATRSRWSSATPICWPSARWCSSRTWSTRRGSSSWPKASRRHAELFPASERAAIIGRFYGAFYSVVNAAALVVQALLVARILKSGGTRLALFLLPVVAHVRLRRDRDVAVAGGGRDGQGRREQRRLLDADDGPADAVPAHGSGEQIQGEGDARHGVRAPRRHGGGWPGAGQPARLRAVAAGLRDRQHGSGRGLAGDRVEHRAPVPAPAGESRRGPRRSRCRSGRRPWTSPHARGREHGRPAPLFAPTLPLRWGWAWLRRWASRGPAAPPTRRCAASRIDQWPGTSTTPRTWPVRRGLPGSASSTRRCWCATRWPARSIARWRWRGQARPAT